MMWAISAAADELRAIDDAGRRRQVFDFDATSAVHGVYRGQPVTSFASNDYLGLSRHPSTIAAAHDALDRWGTGSGSSRLIAGARPVHRELEVELADWKRDARAVVFPSGFAANVGVLTSVARAGTTILSDALNHASIIDGCRLAPAEVVVYPHGDVAAIESTLRRTSQGIVVTETVFSMDGDSPPLEAIVAVCRRHGALLILDEAHAVLAPEIALDGIDVIRVGTLSKHLGAAGGFAAGPAPLIDLIINRARAFIYTTAPAPADVAAAMAALRVVRSAEGEALMARLRHLAGRLRPGHASPILPIVLGDEVAALAASDRFLHRGLLVPAIRPPTVPVGESRLRVSVSAAHSDLDIDRLLHALDGVPATA